MSGQTLKPADGGTDVPLRLLLRGLALRRARCRRGRISATWFTRVGSCPVCRALIATCTGEVPGGVAINLVTNTIRATNRKWSSRSCLGGRQPCDSLSDSCSGGALFSLVSPALVRLLGRRTDLTEQFGGIPSCGHAGLAPVGRGLSTGTASGVRSGYCRIIRVRTAATMQRAPDIQNADS